MLMTPSGLLVMPCAPLCLRRRPSPQDCRRPSTQLILQCRCHAQAAPYAGVALGSGLLVYAIQQRRLNNQAQRNRELQVRGGVAGPGQGGLCRCMACTARACEAT